MAYTFFFIYLILICSALFICNSFRRIKLGHIIIGITSAAYSIAVDIIIGDNLGYYFYLDHGRSTFYIVVAGILIYPVLNIIYVLFLPERGRRFLVYTALWTIAMILFEYLTLKQRIVVFTGWKPIPWSLALYALTYLWINIFYRYLKRKNTTSNPIF